MNRRISIIVMNKKTEEAVSKDGGTVDMDAKPEPDAGANPQVRAQENQGANPNAANESNHAAAAAR